MLGSSLQKAVNLLDEDPDESARLCIAILDDEPENYLALSVLGTIYSRANKTGLAYQFFQRCVDLAPHRPEAHNNVGMCLEAFGRHQAARNRFHEAARRDNRNAAYPANVALTYMEEGERRKSVEWARKAIKLDLSHSGAWQTLGFCSLALGDWETGWKGYEYCLGGKYRKELQFKDEPRWDGSPGKTVVVYGEQGLGDEIMYASCLPDAIRDCEGVIVECDPRLQGLFRRSFPKATVYGTRRVDAVEWPTKHHFDANCAIGSLPRFYRKSPDACPGTPYLVADPERRVQWRALLDSLGPKPKIGICWSGGRKFTYAQQRAVGLEAFRPLMQAVDADWISLQYKDPTAEIEASGLPVRHYSRACETNDYDDLAGLVAELDMVIGIHTTAHHLAGALGVPGIILVPNRTLWTYSLPSMPWYGSATLYKQRENEPWLHVIERLKNDDQLVCRIRSARRSRIPLLHVVGNSAHDGSGPDYPAASADAGDDAGRGNERIHANAVSGSVAGVV